MNSKQSSYPKLDFHSVTEPLLLTLTTEKTVSAEGLGNLKTRVCLQERERTNCQSINVATGMSRGIAKQQS
jgi:hypothetical protein